MKGRKKSAGEELVPKELGEVKWGSQQAFYGFP